MKWNAELYAGKHSFVHELGAPVIDLLDPKPGERILDLGCGSGELTKRLAENGAEVVGIDSSADMIAKAKDNYPNLDLRVMDAKNLGFGNEEFDAIFSNAAFHWFGDPVKATEEMFRVLRKGGRVAMEFGGKGNIGTIAARAKTVLTEHGFEFRDPWYFPSVGEFASLLESTGFVVRYAVLFDRDTELAENENAMIDWLKMFGSGLLENVPETPKEDIVKEIQESLRPQLFRSGRWIADYKRIRIAAEK